MSPQTQWETLPRSDGSIELRVAQRGRRWLVGGVVALAVAWTLGLLRSYAAGAPLPLGSRPSMAALLECVLVGGALWCAFAQEYWVAGRCFFEAHLEFGPWRRARRVVGQATLLLAQKSSTNWNVPYGRLFIIGNGRRMFLCDRSLEQATALATFLATQTGWTLTYERQVG